MAASLTGSDITKTCKKFLANPTGSVPGTRNQRVGGTTQLHHVDPGVDVSDEIHCVPGGQFNPSPGVRRNQPIGRPARGR